LLVIEDACHALGAEYNNKGRCGGGAEDPKNAGWIKVGASRYSDMTVFSFHPVKSITTGEGGAVLTNREDLYEKLLMLQNHGITKNKAKFKNSTFSAPWYYEQQLLGFNYRITDFQCALGISQLKKINRFMCRRREIAEIYEREFKDNPFFDLPVERNYVKSCWHLYPIKLRSKYKDKKKLIFNRLEKKGLRLQVHYIPVYWQPYYQQLGYKKGMCPAAEDFYQRGISIPLYPAMTDKDVYHVVKNIFECFQELR